MDEGQDYHPDWWIALEMVIGRGETGPIYVFFDPAQNLFVSENLTIPDLRQPFDLPANCRNTRNLVATCGEICGIEIPVRPDAPEGIECVVNFIPLPEARAEIVCVFVSDWISTGKLSCRKTPSCHHLTKARSYLGSVSKVAKTNICSNLNEWRAFNGVLLTTIRSCKGLEADAIVVSNVVKPETTLYFSVSGLNFGCSRAKHIPVILVIETGVFQ